MNMKVWLCFLIKWNRVVLCDISFERRGMMFAYELCACEWTGRTSTGKKSLSRHLESLFGIKRVRTTSRVLPAEFTSPAECPCQVSIGI